MTAVRTVVAILLLVLIGSACIAFSIALVPYLVRRQVEQSVILKNNTESYENWLEPSAPIYIDFYFFNITNSGEVVGNWSIRPRVQQIGPYVYREICQKTNVSFNASSNLLYREHKWYVFDRNMSAGSENDTFTTVNLPLLTIATKLNASSVSKWLQRLFVAPGFAAVGEHLFERRSVYELLWGYEWKFPFFPQWIQNIINKAIADMNNNSTTFGVYVGPTANGTDDGLYEINSGTQDLSKLGFVETWNEQKFLPYWSTRECNMINGTDGTFWHPYVSPDERLYLFSSDLCRSVSVTCVNCQQSLVVSSVSIPTLRFTPPPDVFADESTNPGNGGFRTSRNLSYGVLDVSACRSEAPIVMSSPHFYQADERYLHAIEGLQPNPSYETFVQLEPTTGMVLNVSRKVQVNAYIGKLPSLGSQTNMPDDWTILMPVLWLNEHATIDKKNAVKFQNDVLKPLQLSRTLQIVLYAVGGLILLIAVVVLVVTLFRRQQRRSGRIQTQDDDDDCLLDAGSA